jgi:serine/threonine-protein kinase
MIGETLSHFRITAKLGEGGMGEVYRAEDTNLGREVAIKVLPQAFTEDHEQFARFEREAHVLASLNHPNIANIYELAQSDKSHFLVLELVEGEDLAVRLSRGPILVENALPLALQLAEALEAAHDKGIVHRDLKPANVMVGPDGTAKVLDFGLAKALESDPGPSRSDLTQSPTLTAQMTQEGVLLGTASYMSPEQARGEAADRRADVWAFGIVLMEMLTGKQVVAGKTASEGLAGVLAREPEWDDLPRATPQCIRRLLERCLEKDVRRRLQAIGEARISIESCLAAPEAEDERGPRASWLQTAQWGLIAGLSVAVAIAIWTPWQTERVGLTSRLVIPTAPLATSRVALSLSPDGRRMVYAAEDDAVSGLYLRELDSFEAQRIPGTENAVAPFFSPDDRWVGFFANGKLKKVSASGGKPTVVCDAPNGASGAWGEDGTIVFAVMGEGLRTVPAAGGEPRQLTARDPEKMEWQHSEPRFLPDGRTILFTVFDGGCKALRIAARSLETGDELTLVEGASSPLYSPTGHLLYVQGSGLLAAPFDAESLQITGPSVQVVDEVLAAEEGCSNAQISLSQDGSLAYVSRSELLSGASLVWVSRRGTVAPMTEDLGRVAGPRISPGEEKLVLWIGGGVQQVYLYDLSRGVLSPLTSEGSSFWPLWTPDGQWLVFPHFVGPVVNLFRKRADGSGGIERLTESELHQQPMSFSPDGDVLAYHQSLDPTTGWDIGILEMDTLRVVPFLETPANERWPSFSPDGSWLAYSSNESGRPEIWVTEYPGPGRKELLSVGGGTEPAWSPQGDELFYRNRDKMMVVPVVTQPRLSIGKPDVLFEGVFQAGSYGRNYDVSGDAQRFVMVQGQGGGSIAGGEGIASVRRPTQIQVVLNWTDELERIFEGTSN